MPLVFSPLAETVLDTVPKRLLPKHAFVMRQIGSPPEIDLRMAEIVKEVFLAHEIKIVDADASTGGKDFLERILGLIRATGFTVAIYSHKTRPTAIANIMLELGFAAMSGKPLVIVKSERAKAPSDLTRTDWIVYSDTDEDGFRLKLKQATETIDSLVQHEKTVLDVALGARSIDCAIAFERANKGFLLSGDRQFIEAAREILSRLDSVMDDPRISDIERLRSEIKTFLRQAEHVEV
ncbi:hypothetical protein [Methylocystis sp.]|uniref:hypothetical protein n=1 Tax=Methylocystis sp. TaxID=1911079 RepID=UPI003D0B4314